MNALAQVMTTMGNVYWQFNANTCKIERFGVTKNPPSGSEANVACDCTFSGNVCHVISMYEMKAFFLFSGAENVFYSFIFASELYIVYIWILISEGFEFESVVELSKDTTYRGGCRGSSSICLTSRPCMILVLVKFDL